MLNATIKWEFWEYVWGYYFGENPRSFQRSYYDRVEKISFSPDVDKILDDISWNYQRQAWDLWNAPMEIAGNYLHACAVSGDAKSVFPDWNSFFAAKCPWHHGTGKYPLHLSMLMANWPHVGAGWEAYDRSVSIEKGRMMAELEETSKRNKEEKLQKWRQEFSNPNPHLISAIYQAGTGNSIHIGSSGPIGASAIASILANGRKPPINNYPFNTKLH